MYRFRRFIGDIQRYLTQTSQSFSKEIKPVHEGGEMYCITILTGRTLKTICGRDIDILTDAAHLLRNVDVYTIHLPRQPRRESFSKEVKHF